MAMTDAQKQEYFKQYGCYPIETEDLADVAISLTQDQINEAESIIAKRRARQYLAETDWYVTRNAETGKAVPDDILAKRAQARLDAGE